MQCSAHYRYPQSFPQSVAAVIACSHYQSPIVKYGTVERSDLAKCRQDDLCCRRTIRRWNPEARSFRLMYGTCTPAADEKFFIHTPVSSKSSVPIAPSTTARLKSLPAVAITVMAGGARGAGGGRSATVGAKLTPWAFHSSSQSIEWESQSIVL